MKRYAVRLEVTRKLTEVVEADTPAEAEEMAKRHVGGKSKTINVKETTAAPIQRG